MAVAGQPDAGIWEYRSGWRPQTFSTLMCWAAADRMSRIARQHRPADAEEFASAAAAIRGELLLHAVHPERGCLVADYGGTEVDAALLQAVTLGLLPDDDPRLGATIRPCARISSTTVGSGGIERTTGSGAPSVAFMLCTFWQVEALARLGRATEAREILDRVRRVKSPLGLLAEDLDPVSGVMWGNFPQAYSHVGLIHAAFAASPRWLEHGS